MSRNSEQKANAKSASYSARAASFRFVHSKGLHQLHRKRERVSYNFQLVTAQKRRDLLDMLLQPPVAR
jgi:hypothetical protein